MSGSSVRALARIARRDIARHRARSVLVTLLVLLPVAAMIAGISVYRTTQPTQERQDVWRMGRADLIAQGVSEAELRSYLPDGSIVEQIAFTDGNVVIPGARPAVSIRGLDLDGLAQGMLVVVDGRTPTGIGEVAISAALAALVDVGVGGQLTLDGSPPAEVVGIVENQGYLGDRLVLLEPSAVTTGDDEFGSWLVGLPEGASPEDVVESTFDPETGAQDVLIQSRRSGRLGALGGESTSGTILVLGALALIEAALIASAAFAVSIRRRQRELGLLAAAGATPRQLAATVVAEAAILGLLACLAGVAVGLLGALALTPWLDELTQRRNPPPVIDVAGILGPVVIGFLAAMIAAIVPARTVARVPVLVSLSGRRPPEAPARRNLRAGLGAVALSVAMTGIGAGMRIGGDETISLFLMIGGAVLGTLGFGACGPWLLERLERVAVRMPLPGRIAFRDAARARSRSSPIVTAVLASFAATIALGTWTVSRNAANVSEWQPWLYPDQLLIRGAAAAAAGPEVATELGAIAGAGMADLTVAAPSYFWIEVPGVNYTVNINEAGESIEVPTQLQKAVVATPDILAIVRAEAAAPDLAAGKVVILTDLRGPPGVEAILTADEVEIVIQGPSELEPPTRTRYPATVLVTELAGGALPQALLPGSIAEELALEAWPEPDFVIQLDHTVTETDLAQAAAIAERFVDTYADAALGPQRPDEAFRLVMIALALLFAVSITGVAIALAEAESRPEQRSLLALGADPQLRRRIVAARAAVLTLLAGVLAVPAGLLPVWGLLASRDAPFVVPWLEVAGAVALLPVLAVACAAILSRPIPDWAAFRGIGAGE